MKREDLYESMEGIDEEILARSEARGKGRRPAPRWVGVIAAVLVVAILGVTLLWPGGGAPLTASAYAVAEAAYPAMNPYPNEDDYLQADGTYDDEAFSAAYDAWRTDQQARQQPEGYAAGLENFWQQSMKQFLAGSQEENQVYSPVNLYLALAMLAEVTDGASRQQILDLLGQDTVEALGAQAQAVWQANYCADGANTCILANSLWLNQDVTFLPETVQTLAQNYYASTYQGEMGSADFDKALQNWLSTQTGGLLDDQIQDLTLDANTVLALASTISFQSKWSREFSPDATAPQTFHSPAGDVTCDFLHSSRQSTYYWGEHFSAVGLYLAAGGILWLLLPDEGLTPQDLLADDQAMDFLRANGNWADQKYLMVNLSLPKFDVAGKIDLRDGLQELGITDVFGPAVSDFSPMTTQTQGIFLSQARQGVRVAIDEEGVTAAAYTVIAGETSEAPPEEVVDFVLDRPFLFVLASDDGLPLFAGTVAQPG